ncbi:hypothetical protein KSP39_PZI010118 [Platanthera zijinensis]|uniref:Ubiquinone biosynthesis protein n=1 Tax=Platanthera zijinensis TaxID=2320716 RepID=A0AAP0BKE3_9ASPA
MNFFMAQQRNRILLQSSCSRLRLCFLTRFRPISTEASSDPIPPHNPFNQYHLPEQETPISKLGEDDGAVRMKPSSRTTERDGYEDEQARVLRAAISHVPRLGWSESAMISGARDVGVSPSIVGSFPRREAALVEFFMDDCLTRFVDRIGSGEELRNLMLSNRLAKLVRIRLEMQVPYITKWPQALGIQTQPSNLPASLKQRAVLVDEIWHAAGDKGSDIDWYMKRTILGAIYSTSEVYMLTDRSPATSSGTWTSQNDHVVNAFLFKKYIQDITSFAVAVFAATSSLMNAFPSGSWRRDPPESPLLRGLGRAAQSLPGTPDCLLSSPTPRVF